MNIIYNGKKISDYDYLKVSETQKQPEIQLNVSPEKIYTLILHDPNAVNGERIHWFRTNIKNNDINTGIDILPHVGPAPPPKTGKHKYIFGLYEKEFKDVPELKEEDRNKYNEIVKTYKINKPIIEIRFISQNENGGKKRRTKKNKRRKSKRTRRRY